MAHNEHVRHKEHEELWAGWSNRAPLAVLLTGAVAVAATFNDIF